MTSHETDIPSGAVTEPTQFENEGTLLVRTGQESAMKNWVPKNDNPSSYCPDGVECKKLGSSCILCNFNDKCIYGREYNTTCSAKEGINCTVYRNILTYFITIKCLYSSAIF